MQDQNNPNKEKFNSYLTNLLLILLILACVIAGFFATRTQKLVKEINDLRLEQMQKKPEDPKEVEKTLNSYQIKKYAFSIKYPPTWSIDEKVQNIKNNGFLNLNSPNVLDTETKDSSTTIQETDSLQVSIKIFDPILKQDQEQISEWAEKNMKLDDIKYYRFVRLETKSEIYKIENDAKNPSQNPNTDYYLLLNKNDVFKIIVSYPLVLDSQNESEKTNYQKAVDLIEEYKKQSLEIISSISF